MGLYAKMAAIMGAIDKVDKDAQMNAGAFRYKYVTDVQVYHAVRKQLVEHGIALFASMTDVHQERIVLSVDDKGNQRDKFHTRARFEFVLVDSESGEQMSCTWYGEAQDSGDKGVNKCATAALKYWLMKTFVIPTGDDPDDMPSVAPVRAVNAQPGEVTRSEATPAPRAQRSTQETDAPHRDELPPAAQERASEYDATQDARPLSQATLPPLQQWIMSRYPNVKSASHASNTITKALQEEGRLTEKVGWPELFGKAFSVAAVAKAVDRYEAAEGNAPAEQPALLEVPAGHTSESDPLPRTRRRAG